MLSSLIAGIAGVLLTPVFAGQVGYTEYEALVIAAIAAAVLGGLGSIPVPTWAGCSGRWIMQLLFQYLPTNNILASAPNRIAVRRGVRRARAVAGHRPEPLDVGPAGRGRSAAARACRFDRSAGLTRMTRVFGVVFFAVVGYYLFFHANGSWVDLAVRAAILSIIFLSITVITGFAGQISLCQATFAAIGACATAQLSAQQGVPVLGAMVIGAVIAAVGAALALPMMRLGGIFLSLATLAFAFFFDQVVLQLGWVGAGTQILLVPRPVMGSIDLSGRQRLFSCWPSHPRPGEHRGDLGAERHDRPVPRRDARERGCRRVDRHQPQRARIVAFALSAAIAGLGGGLMASYIHPGRRRTSTLPSRPSSGSPGSCSSSRSGRARRRGDQCGGGLRVLPGGRAPDVDSVARRPRAALVPHDLVAGRSAADPVRPRRASPTRSIPEGHPRVPEAPFVRAHPGLIDRFKHRARWIRPSESGTGPPVVAASAGGSS